MNHKYLFYVLLIPALLFGAGGCSSDSSETEAADQGETQSEEHAAPKGGGQPDVAGLYMGTIPCADCPGIEYKLLLKDDMTFSEMVKHLERDEKPMERIGTYVVSPGGWVSLNRFQESPSRLFKVHEEGLLMLDKEGNEITGSTASQYVIKRTVN